MSVLTDHPINGLITNFLTLSEDEGAAKVKAALDGNKGSISELDLTKLLGEIANIVAKAKG